MKIGAASNSIARILFSVFVQDLQSAHHPFAGPIGQPMKFAEPARVVPKRASRPNVNLGIVTEPPLDCRTFAMPATDERKVDG